jgi:hypothetical protein
MEDIRKIDVPEIFERVETGAIQFGEDWPGLFVRGDNSAMVLFELQRILENKDRLEYQWLFSLKDLIQHDVLL